MQVGDLPAGRYRLDRRLGQGSMGEVWRGHDLALDRSVAVEVLLEAATNDEVAARFRRGATIGARLRHPGITVVHDVGQQDGRLFIVTELPAGEDPATVPARDGGLAVDLAVDLAAQTAQALAAAHEQSVVHRDLKPADLFLLPGRRLKICHFGIAYSAGATAGRTVTGRMSGTPAYRAPEQWRGERVGARCDLYALGCVLYALLSGAPPFGQAEGPYALMRRHIEEPPLPLREVGAPVPPYAGTTGRPRAGFRPRAGDRARRRDRGRGCAGRRGHGSSREPNSAGCCARYRGGGGSPARGGSRDGGRGPGRDGGRGPGRDRGCARGRGDPVFALDAETGAPRWQRLTQRDAPGARSNGWACDPAGCTSGSVRAAVAAC
ncbi:serine/threonine-protein kinase [Streptomyces sp. NPDC057686]|uniref:serine/threonine-protein kinase n=1 Tax=Streptomyces sp. NPDC057686 TaxID=3346212 RepID=UPI00367727D8